MSGPLLAGLLLALCVGGAWPAHAQVRPGLAPVLPSTPQGAVRASSPAANLPPQGVIAEPATNITVTAGDTVQLAATGSDPDNNLPLQFHWNLNGAAPDVDGAQARVVLSTAGVYTITLVVTDALGQPDLAPPQRVITVSAPPPSLPHEVHWTLSGTNSVTLDWRGGPDFVRFGLDTQYGGVVRATVPSPLPFSSAGPFREARIDGLLQDAVYHYSIGFGADHTFRSSPPAGASDFDVYVTADVGSSTSYREIPALEQIIASDMPRFCLVPGDLSYANAHGQKAVGQHFDDMMPWSQDAAYMPAWGNHEWDEPASDDLRNYKGRFELPHSQTSPGSPAVSCCGDDWYWFDYGNVRFIAYPEPWVGAFVDWAKHASDLMDQAQQDPNITFVVTFGHRPAYSSGHHPGNASLKNLIDGLGASHSKFVLNLSGHSHSYERSTPQYGVVHVVSGGGGGGLENDPKNGCMWLSGCPPPSYVAYRAMHHSVLKLHFGPRSIEGWGICGPADAAKNDIACTLGSPMDHFVIGPRPDSLPPAPIDTVVANPSFDVSIAGWTPTRHAVVTRVAGGHDGAFGAQVTSDSSGWFGLNDTPNLVTTTRESGERYHYSSWVRTPSGGGRARLRVREYFAGVLQAPPASSPMVKAGTDWREAALDYVVARGGSTLDFQVLYDPTGLAPLFVVDDISVTRRSSLGAYVPNKPPNNPDPATWDDDDLEDGGGAATLGERLDHLKFEARMFPSPLHDRSVLSFTTTRRGAAQVALYDVSGRWIRTLADEPDLGPGRHEITLDGRDAGGRRLRPGIYLYRVRATEGQLGGRCVVLP